MKSFTKFTHLWMKPAPPLLEKLFWLVVVGFSIFLAIWMTLFYFDLRKFAVDPIEPCDMSGTFINNSPCIITE